ncbi:hypothetical protein ACH5A3_43960 [Streptomyces echinatus]|uniref:hypothetical protein n=1 Tax=Streptomyces echinatus TaxID=67293 RepID=UPI003788C954
MAANRQSNRTASCCRRRPSPTAALTALSPESTPSTWGDGGIRATVGEGGLHAVKARTGPHPGLPTDTAPQLAALLTQAPGTSHVIEAVYPRRGTHVAPLHAFGATSPPTGRTSASTDPLAFGRPRPSGRFATSLADVYLPLHRLACGRGRGLGCAWGRPEDMWYRLGHHLGDAARPS